MRVVKFHEPFEKQKLFLMSRKRYTAYGGARGGGKSDVFRLKAYLLALRWAGIQILFLRRSYPELKENHINVALRDLNGIARYLGQDKSFTFPNGSRIKFGYCRNDADLLQYQGQAYDVIFMDECTQFAENVFLTLTESNRSSGLMQEQFSPRMYFACNPGGIGHAWFKRLFVDRAYKPTERAEDYAFIQANVYDNPWLMEHSPDYVRALENLPEMRRKAMLDGSWDVFEGQYFPEFREGIHTVEPFTIPEGWRRYRFFDYGFDMFACYWAAVDEGGDAVVYREVCEGYDKTDAYGNPGNGLTIAQAARLCLANSPAGENVELTFAPPDMWNRKTDTGRSSAEVFADNGLDIVRVSNNRVQGWHELQDWLQVREDGKPRLRVFKNCGYLIKCLQTVIHDDKNPDDVDSEPHEWSHGADALRYFVAGQPMAARAAKIEDEEFEEVDFEEEVNNFYEY